MRNYLTAECSKAFHRVYFYLMLAVCLLGEALLLLSSWLTYHWGNPNITFLSTAQMVVGILIFGLYAPLICGDIVFSDQYKHNTLKNEVSYGLPRTRIYLGKLIIAFLVSLVAALLFLAFYLGGCWLLFPHSEQDPMLWQVLGYCLSGAFPLWLGGLATFMACFFLIRSNLAASFLPLGLFMLLPSIFQVLGLLTHPVFEVIRQFMPSVMLETLRSVLFDWQYVGLCWIVGLTWFFVSTAIGLVFFRKKEIR